MAEKAPAAEQPYLAGDTTPTPWAEADTYWLATVRQDGLPHLAPLLAVWVDGALHFVASRTSRKATNLAHDAHCVIANRREALDLVVEGTVAKVSQEARLHQLGEGVARYREDYEAYFSRHEEADE